MDSHQLRCPKEGCLGPPTVTHNRMPSHPWEVSNKNQRPFSLRGKDRERRGASKKIFFLFFS